MDRLGRWQSPVSRGCGIQQGVHSHSNRAATLWVGLIGSLLLSLAGCHRKEKRVLRTEPWPAPVALSASGALPSAAPGRPVHYVVESGKVSFELPTRKKKPSGSIGNIAGEIDLDVQHPEATRAELRADLLSLTLSANGRDDAPELLAPATYDVIFCRNVLMYFSPVQAAAVVQRLSRALVVGGFLFLGHAETLRGLSHDFQLKHTHNTFYYQRRADPRQHSSPAPLPVATPMGTATARRTSAAASDAAGEGWVKPWLEGVERSSERIAELSRRAERGPSAASASGIAATERLQEPLELLQSERFGDALALLQRLSPAERTDPATLLLRAALLTHQGDLAEAEKVCHELLRLDDLNAGAHYLLALCCERRGSPQVAIEHDRTAVYLDGGFAMPHLHLGLMARRRREPRCARVDRARALAPRRRCPRGVRALRARGAAHGRGRGDRRLPIADRVLALARRS